MPANAAGTAAFSVRVVRDTRPAGLADLANRKDGSFFHTPEWLALVPRVEPRLRALIVGAWDESETLRAACPLFEARRFGQRFWYSGAWGTYGGIVADDDAAGEAVGHFIASDGSVALLRIHDFAGSMGTAAGFQVTGETCQVLELPADPQTLFVDAFTSQNRNKIRKAEKAGVTVRVAHDAQALAHYAALYREAAARLRVPRLHPPALFAALAGLEGVQVWLAEQNGEPIAALLNLRRGGQIMNWGNASRTDAWGASPNNLLHWRALEAACQDAAGPRLYNFGASTGLPGVETFKASFGATQRTHARLERHRGWVEWMRRLRRR